MTAGSTASSGHSTRSAVLLLVLAVVGGGLFVLLTPARHPLSTASYALGEDGARQAAVAFLADKGYSVDGLVAEVELRTDTRLVNGLQRTLGRQAAISVLRSEDAARLPAFYWQVRFRPSPDYLLPDEESRPYYTLNITQEGTVWSFEQPLIPEEGGAQRTGRRFGRIDAGRRVDREALLRAFSPPAGAEETAPEEAPVDLSSVPDSVFRAALSFNPVDTLWHTMPSGTAFDAEGRAVLHALAEDTLGALNLILGPEAAVALARYHLGGTPWSVESFRADSVWLQPEHDNRIAYVRLAGTAPLHGQHVQARVAVTAAGSLQRMEVSFEDPDAASQEGTFEEVANIIEISVFALLILGILVGFFRRFSARLIDAKAALLDGLVIGLLTASVIALAREINMVDGADSFWVLILVRILLMVVVGAAVALLVMPIAGASDSLARSAWPDKLRTASLLRLGAWRNRFVGAALLRGTAVSMVLLGLVALVLWVFSSPSLVVEESQFLDVRTFRAMPYEAAVSGILAYLLLSLVLLGVGTFTHSRSKNAAVLVITVAVTTALLQGAAVDLEPVGYTWLISLLWGVVLGLTFLRFDFLTSFVAYFLAMLVWFLYQGWIVEHSPIALDMWLAVVFEAGLVVVGLVGVFNRSPAQRVVDYVPAYVQDLKQKERLKGELEIAREVQESFLPRRMPSIEGLDIAGMCLAALEIGGDYFDFVQLGPSRLAIVVGDVSGKGTQAAFYMTLTKGIMQTLGREGLSPADVMRRFNTVFCAIAPRGTFISMIYGVIDAEDRTFTFVRAGHNPVILKRSPNQDADLIKPNGLGIGFVAGPAFDDTIEEATLHLRLGDVLVFYTDGFSEAMNGAKDLYGDERLARKVGDVGQRSANEILRGVTEDVHHFMEAAGRRDDMTMVVIKIKRGSAPRPSSTDHREAVVSS